MRKDMVMYIFSFRERAFVAILILSVMSSNAQNIMIRPYNPDGMMSFSGVLVGSTATVQWAYSLTPTGSNKWNNLESIYVTNTVMQAELPVFFRILGMPDTNGLIAYYRFNGDTYDWSGNGYDGVGANIIPTTNSLGMTNSAYLFNYSSWVEIPDNVQLRTVTNWTLSAWAMSVNPSSYNDRIIDKAGDNFSGVAGYQLAYLSDNRFYFGAGWGGGGSGIMTPAAYAPNQWHLVTGTYDGSVASLYIDGILTTNAALSLVVTSAKPVQIGRFLQTGSGSVSGWGGSIDDVRIYNRALSAGEVLHLFQSTP